jgi:hypothetical protein
VHGDVGSTLIDVSRAITSAAGTAATLAFTGSAAISAGRALAAQGPPPPPANGPGPGPGGGAIAAGISRGTSAPVAADATGGLSNSTPPQPIGSREGRANLGSSNGLASTASTENDSAVSSSASTGNSPSVLWNPRTGQVFSWNGSGWEAAGHVTSPAESPLVQASGGSYGITHWQGQSAGQSRPSYRGHSLFGYAVWQAGTLAGRAMRAVGMEKAA